ncbi:MAG: hypothetical protein ABR501_05160 [Pyrinomonadaceae bacterium]
MPALIAHFHERHRYDVNAALTLIVREKIAAASGGVLGRAVRQVEQGFWYRRVAERKSISDTRGSQDDPFAGIDASLPFYLISTVALAGDSGIHTTL